MKSRYVFFLMTALFCLNIMASSGQPSIGQMTATTKAVVDPNAPKHAQPTAAPTSATGTPHSSSKSALHVVTSSAATTATAVGTTPLSPSSARSPLSPASADTSRSPSLSPRNRAKSRTAAALSPHASDEKRTAEGTTDEAQINEYVGTTIALIEELEKRTPGLGASAASQAFFGIDKRNKNSAKTRLNYRVYAKTVFGQNPKEPTDPQITSLARPVDPKGQKETEELIRSQHVSDVLTAISEIPQPDGTLDLTAVERLTLTHFRGQLNGDNASTAASETRARTLDEATNSEVAEARKRVEKQLIPQVRKKIKDQETPKVKDELKKELRQQQDQETWLKYAACFGLGAVTGLGIYALLWNSSTEPSKTQK